MEKYHVEKVDTLGDFFSLRFDSIRIADVLINWITGYRSVHKERSEKWALIPLTPHIPLTFLYSSIRARAPHGIA